MLPTRAERLLLGPEVLGDLSRTTPSQGWGNTPPQIAHSRNISVLQGNGSRREVKPNQVARSFRKKKETGQKTQVKQTGGLQA